MYTNNSFKRSGGYFQFSIFWRCWQNAFNIFGTLYKMYVLATFTITSGFFFLMLSEQHFSQSNIEYKSKSWNQKNDFSLSQKSCGQMIVPFEQLLLFLPLLYLSLLPQIKDKVIDYWLVLGRQHSKKGEGRVKLIKYYFNHQQKGNKRKRKSFRLVSSLSR